MRKTLSTDSIHPKENKKVHSCYGAIRKKGIFGLDHVKKHVALHSFQQVSHQEKVVTLLATGCLPATATKKIDIYLSF